MNYKTLSAWIFVGLLLSVFLMFIFPSPLIIGIGTIGVPVLIFLQAFIILHAKDESKHTFDDGRWYDR